LTYPKDGSAKLSDKAIFVSNVKAGDDLKVILKVKTKNNGEYYLAYVPESTYQNFTSSGSYIYLPLYAVSDTERSDWLLVSANIAEDLQRNQLEYEYTSWISFHGKELSIDNVGFSTEILETTLQ
jgi:hypothetical protein